MSAGREADECTKPRGRHTQRRARSLVLALVVTCALSHFDTREALALTIDVSGVDAFVPYLHEWKEAVLKSDDDAYDLGCSGDDEDDEGEGCDLDGGSSRSSDTSDLEGCAAEGEGGGTSGADGGASEGCAHEEPDASAYDEGEGCNAGSDDGGVRDASDPGCAMDRSTEQWEAEAEDTQGGGTSSERVGCAPDAQHPLAGPHPRAPGSGAPTTQAPGNPAVPSDYDLITRPGAGCQPDETVVITMEGQRVVIVDPGAERYPTSEGCGRAFVPDPAGGALDGDADTDIGRRGGGTSDAGMSDARSPCDEEDARSDDAGEDVDVGASDSGDAESWDCGIEAESDAELDVGEEVGPEAAPDAADASEARD